MKQISILLLATVLFYGCEKSIVGDTYYTFKGTLYKDCSKTPVPNTVVSLFDPIIYGGLGTPYSGPTVLGSDTTDSNGNFEIKYKITTGFFPSAQFLVNGSAELYNVETGKNIDSAIVYRTFTTNINVMLNVTNPYTASDTLWVNDLTGKSTNVKIVGPFKSGLLYTANNYQLLMPNYQYSDSANTTKLGYKISSNNWKLSNKFYIYPCATNDLIINVQ